MISIRDKINLNGTSDKRVFYLFTVWPNEKVVFPDFFKPETHTWWEKVIDEFRTNSTHGAPTDGLWIDMNEPSSFDTNELKPWNWLYPLNDTEKYPLFTLKCPVNRLDDPPYRTRESLKRVTAWIFIKILGYFI
jgi:alpha-glucosidase (family GH31 glycosyl hydrolase)